ncbi:MULTISPECIES: adenosine deaminase [unclassified Saccharopolyspora]|uniref:adenosine deaminase n=1 Tax=unclassified Saccharopolyspora TaxID=2646250 RepID=UPI001CD4EC32|nr:MULTISPECIES: adenosine deaminase [unclassified Saccharopolyspora]MCA1184827.1 adenosine deaminase [Saccharopolyspora sp. 6T]MCA1226421.1 adenosine deaminase [Saccharopolyspora sp. 6M]MCA1280872.1 adenosine deaminase [Saccharopolyspora sp. 7B]
MNAAPTPPKAELHVHIEGTLEPEMVFDLARRNGIELPHESVADLRAKYRFSDLQSFLDIYYANMAVLRTEADFHDLAAAYLDRCAEQGVRHAEIFFDPQAHLKRGVPMETVIGGLHSALADSDVSASLILCFLRDESAESAAEALRLAEPFLDRIVGVGLDSAEVGHPPSKFTEVFARARELGLRAVAHAGEEGPPEYVREALDLLGVQRVDHGIRALEDPELVERLRRERIPLTVCPLSNVRLGAFAELSGHTLPELLARGLLVTVNSDDPAYFGGYVDENFDAVRRELGLSTEQLRELAANSFRAAFLDERRRDEFLAEVAAWTP